MTTTLSGPPAEGNSPIAHCVRAGIRTPRWLFAAALVPSAAVLLFIALQPYVPAAQAFRDVYGATRNAQPNEFPPLLGFASNVGILLWCAACAVAFFAHTLVRQQRGIDRKSACLLALSGFSGLLLLDDLFMLHEYVYPRLGLHEVLVFAAYGFVLAAILLVFRDVIRLAGWSLVLVAAVFFAIAVVADVADMIPGVGGPLQRWAEDAPKLVGAAVWAVFVMRLAWLLCAEVEREAGLPAVHFRRSTHSHVPSLRSHGAP